MFNAYWEPLDFELPVLAERIQDWWRWIDTALDPPHDICEWNRETQVPESTYRVGARSVVVLIAGEGSEWACRGSPTREAIRVLAENKLLSFLQDRGCYRWSFQA